MKWNGTLESMIVERGSRYRYSFSAMNGISECRFAHDSCHSSVSYRIECEALGGHLHRVLTRMSRHEVLILAEALTLARLRRRSALVASVLVTDCHAPVRGSWLAPRFNIGGSSGFVLHGVTAV